jgi:hypothetical protein
MNFGQIQDEVDIILADKSLVDSIPGYINDIYAEACFRVKLPSLKNVATVDTVVGVNWVTLTSLTGEFSGKLLRFGDPSTVSLYHSLEDLYDRYFDDWDEEGSVTGVALEGNIIWYQAIPAAAETHTVIYMSRPTALVKRPDIPTHIPEPLHRKILIHGAAMIGWDKIEDGMEGEKVNTASNRIEFEKGITQLREWVGGNKQHRMLNYWSV